MSRGDALGRERSLLVRMILLLGCCAALAPVSGAEQPLALAIMQFETNRPEQRLGFRASDRLAAELQHSPYVRLVAQAEAALLDSAEQTSTDASPVLLPEQNPDDLAVSLGPSHVVSGAIWALERGYEVSVQVVSRATRAVVPGLKQKRVGPEWESLVADLAEQIHLRLTGGLMLGADADARLVTGPNSTVQLELGFGRWDHAAAASVPVTPARPGQPAVFGADDFVRVTVSSNTTGYVQVIAVGADGVYPLYPVGNLPGRITAGELLDLPLPEYELHNVDPRGFQATGDQPGIEHVHAFFSRQPIGFPVRPGTLTGHYRTKLLPDLIRAYQTIDPQWTGTSARYFYAVNERDPFPVVALPSRDESGPTDTSELRAAERGAEIFVERAVGVGPIVGAGPEAEAAARGRALVDARRMALESALGVMVQSTTTVELYQLTSDLVTTASRQGYVRLAGEPTQDERVGDHWVVAISAYVTARELLTHLRTTPELVAAVYAELDHPRVAVLMTDEVNGRLLPGNSVVATELAADLTRHGLTVIDQAQLDQLREREKVVQALLGNAEAIGWLGVELGAELLITGRAAAALSSEARPGLGFTGLAELELRCIDTSTGRQITATSRPLSVTKLRSTTSAEEQNLVGRGVIRQAARLLLQGSDREPAWVDQLVAAWMSAPRELQVVVPRASVEEASELARLVGHWEPAGPTLHDMRTAPTANLPGIRPFRCLDQRVNPGYAVLRLTTPLRPHQALEQLAVTVRAAGWELAASEGNRINLVRSGLEGTPAPPVETPPPAPSQGRQVVISLGIDRYSQPGLRAWSEAGAVAQRLAAGLAEAALEPSDLFLLTGAAAEPDAQPRRASLVKALKRAEAAAPDDLVVVYLAGHLVDATGGPYLALQDWDDTDPDLMGLTGVSLDWLRGRLTKLPSRRVLLLIDAVRGSPREVAEPAGSPPPRLTSDVVVGDDGARLVQLIHTVEPAGGATANPTLAGWFLAGWRGAAATPAQRVTAASLTGFLASRLGGHGQPGGDAEVVLRAVVPPALAVLPLAGEYAGQYATALRRLFREQGQVVGAIDQDEVVAAVGYQAGAAVGEDLAQELRLRCGARWLVSGGSRRVGDEIELAVTLQPVEAQAAPPRQEEVRFRPDAWQAGLADLATRLSASLGR